MENTRTEKEIQDINMAVFIDTVDKILGKELNTKQAKKIMRQIKRLERKINSNELETTLGYWAGILGNSIAEMKATSEHLFAYLIEI